MANRFVDLYAEVQARGLEYDSHESDLYIKGTPEARALVEGSGWTFTTFRDARDPERAWWYDVAFAYHPWWAARERA